MGVTLVDLNFAPVNYTYEENEDQRFRFSKKEKINFFEMTLKPSDRRLIQMSQDEFEMKFD